MVHKITPATPLVHLEYLRLFHEIFLSRLPLNLEIPAVYTFFQARKNCEMPFLLVSHNMTNI